MKVLVGAGTMLGALAPAVAQTPPPPSATYVVEAEARPVITDASITADITVRLENLVMLRNAQLTISTTHGVVTLVGMVPTDFARQEALQVAKTTPGVIMIDDMMRLPVGSPSAPLPN
jgi:hypothetical protein